MPRYYVHIEAFNYDVIISDTHDISTIRGGSYMLLDAIRQITKAIPDGLQPIATAASKGLFMYEDPGDLAAQQTGMVRKLLGIAHDATGGHATFLGAVVEDQGDFRLALAQLEADVRRQQWRMPTVVVPAFAKADQECYLDGWRPGVKPYTVDPDVKEAKMTAATWDRRERGRTLKHTLFRELFGREDDEYDLCAKDLGELATDGTKGILNGKIAFIHIDGNSFGRIRNAYCDSPAARTAFDVNIQGAANAFLADLRSAALADPDFRVWSHGRERLRLEVLLWGGDERTLIVPAWKGLEVLERFFRITAGLEFEGIPMTHRAALIFCHHNAPILQIRRLAEELLTVTKKDITARFTAAFGTDPALAGLDADERALAVERLSNPAYGNAARYLVLESFDMLRGSLGTFLEHYYGPAFSHRLLLYASRLPAWRAHFRTICSAAPKGRVLEIARALIEGDNGRADGLRLGLFDSIPSAHRDAVKAGIAALTQDGPAGWLLLADLWDYAQECKA